MRSERTQSSSQEDTIDIAVPMGESAPLGEIKINNAVIQQIVALATKEVDGVASIGRHGFVDELTAKLSTRKETYGVIVEENDDDLYLITIRVILYYGYDLAQVAVNIQNSVREQIQKMTNKQILRIDVIIEDIEMPPSKVTTDNGDEQYFGQLSHSD